MDQTSVITHRIDLLPAPRGRARVFHADVDLGISAEPLFFAASHLLREGIASQDDAIAGYYGDFECFAANVGKAAESYGMERSFGSFYPEALIPVSRRGEFAEISKKIEGQGIPTP